MCKPLFPLADRTFAPLSRSLAEEIGNDQARFLLQLEYLLQTLNAKEHDGKRWVYRSCRDFAQIDFFDWSYSRVFRTIKSLLAKNLLLVETHMNTWKKDRTSWYTLNLEEINKLESVSGRNSQKDVSERNDHVSQRNKFVSERNDNTEDLKRYIKDSPLPPQSGGFSDSYISSKREHASSRKREDAGPAAVSEKQVTSQQLVEYISSDLEQVASRKLANDGTQFGERSSRALGTNPRAVAARDREVKRQAELEAQRDREEYERQVSSRNLENRLKLTAADRETIESGQRVTDFARVVMQRRVEMEQEVEVEKKRQREEETERMKFVLADLEERRLRREAKQAAKEKENLSLDTSEGKDSDDAQLRQEEPPCDLPPTDQRPARATEDFSRHERFDHSRDSPRSEQSLQSDDRMEHWRKLLLL